MSKPLPINFGKMVADKSLQGDSPDSKPVPRVFALKTDQLLEPDTSDRVESLKTDWEEFLDSIRATARTSQQGAGNHTPIIAVGLQAPFEIVNGRRRYLACRELGLPIEAKVYPFLGEDDKAHFKYSENFLRNNYTPYEIIMNTQKELERGRDREWIRKAFGKSVRTIDAYIAIAKDARLTEEVKRGLSRREASRLIQEFGENAATEAAKLRRTEGSQETDRHAAVKSKPKGPRAGLPEGFLTAKVVPGDRVLVRFDERKARKEDFFAYGKWLDSERERIGALIGARFQRKQGEA